ncbi:unnamed protein product [Polarella glacialis]|uniref:Uncharacterized protein n=1 Tax=Polarella glacialis TaxID=89957 RepID=A0A813KWX9_POLGL|nr:unnamed protein product [Polarella glacialis]
MGLLSIGRGTRKTMMAASLVKRYYSEVHGVRVTDLRCISDYNSIYCVFEWVMTLDLSEKIDEHALAALVEAGKKAGQLQKGLEGGYGCSGQDVQQSGSQLLRGRSPGAQRDLGLCRRLRSLPAAQAFL